MKRRTLLSTAAVALGGVFGGCSGNGNAEPNGSTAATGAPTTTAGPQTATTSAPATETTAPATANTTPPTTATKTTFRTPDTPTPVSGSPSTPGGMDEAQVAFENGGSRVVVTGTITGQDGCRKAVLESVQPNGGDLVITVGTERDAGTNTMCTQALTPVNYRFVVTPDTPPDSVTVVHSGTSGRRTVTTVDTNA